MSTSVKSYIGIIFKDIASKFSRLETIMNLKFSKLHSTYRNNLDYTVHTAII